MRAHRSGEPRPPGGVPMSRVRPPGPRGRQRRQEHSAGRACPSGSLELPEKPFPSGERRSHFLRGTWMDGAQRLAWLEDYAGAAVRHADLPAPGAVTEGIRLEHVTFRYPGADRAALDDVS